MAEFGQRNATFVSLPTSNRKREREKASVQGFCDAIQLALSTKKREREPLTIFILTVIVGR